MPRNGDIVSYEYEDFVNENEVWYWGENGKFEKHQLNQLIAGDTDSCYLQLPENIEDFLEVDDIINISDELVKEIDSEFPDHVVDVFNCPKSRSDVIKTDREVVSDKSFFLTKKRYAMHVIDDEGKKVDKTKIMGLEIKKSDTPPAVAEFLTELVDLVLDGCTREDLIEAKDRFKERYYKMPYHKIGKPSSTQSMKKYMEEYEMTESMKGFPYHVRAAMFYNSLCSDSDKKVILGERFYTVYIKNRNSKYIGIPMDMNNPPDFLDDIIIDYDTNWQKAEKKIINYMESLGWDLKTVIKNRSTDMFGISKEG